jgi:hypothetical protein
MYTGTYPFLFFSCYQCKCGFSSTEVDGIALHCYTAGLEAGRAEDAKRRIESATAAAPTVVVRGQDTTDSSTTRSGVVYNTNTVPTGTVYGTSGRFAQPGDPLNLSGHDCATCNCQHCGFDHERCYYGGN